MSTDVDRYTIPIFPLENVVLFPGLKVPLHIFEPRYRQMTQDALDSNRRIGMAVVRPDQIDAIQDQPDLFDVGCVGQIEESNELPGGRFHIVLDGVARFRIESEEPPNAERLYRVAKIQQLTDELREQDKPRVIELRAEVRQLMRQLLAIVAPKRVELFEQQPIQQFDDETFVNTLSQSIDFLAPEKQALLEANGVHERCEKLATFMRFRLAELASGGTPGSNAVQ
jgi:hypothetical protein